MRRMVDGVELGGTNAVIGVGRAERAARQRRCGGDLRSFGPGGPEQQMVAGYLGQALATLALAAAPSRIAIGGGVMKTPALHATAAGRDRCCDVTAPALAAPGFVVPPAAGLTEALLLAGRG
ncbi:MAG: hypothetical protein RQ966_08045 [Acetobacteraceae bacterium]|nr:hypothetical protein [Acetobacteraceae bacterium]